MTNVLLRQNLNVLFFQCALTAHRNLMLVTRHIRSALCTLLGKAVASLRWPRQTLIGGGSGGHAAVRHNWGQRRWWPCLLHVFDDVITPKLVHNYVKLRVSLMVLYCVEDTGYGLCRSLGDCRPALPKGQKYQMVKTQTESHIRRPVVWTNRWQIWVFFSFEFLRGTAGICHTGLWGFSEAL